MIRNKSPIVDCRWSWIRKSPESEKPLIRDPGLQNPVSHVDLAQWSTPGSGTVEI